MTQQTYVPEVDFGAFYDFMARADADKRRFFLSGPNDADKIELPESVHQILVQVVTAMNSGRAVSIMPQSMTLTTQQAADLLGVSRPTLVRLVDQGAIPADRVGARRRLSLNDVLRYREVRRSKQYEALREMSDELDDDEAEEAIARSREARKAIKAKRALPSN